MTQILCSFWSAGHKENPPATPRAHFSAINLLTEGQLDYSNVAASTTTGLLHHCNTNVDL